MVKLRALCTVFVVVLLFAGTVSAGPVQPRVLFGRVVMDFHPAGIRIAVDRIEEGAAADGVIDDEYFVMIEKDVIVERSEVAFEQAWVRASERAVRVAAPGQRPILFTLTGDDPSTFELPTPGEGPGVARAPLAVAPQHWEGYGLRHSAPKQTDAEWRNWSPASEAMCDAGAPCGTRSCSVGCTRGSCEITCSDLNYSACCECNLSRPLCTCVACY